MFFQERQRLLLGRFTLHQAGRWAITPRLSRGRSIARQVAHP
jgi:hypothetical protein